MLRRIFALLAIVAFLVPSIGASDPCVPAASHGTHADAPDTDTTLPCEHGTSRCEAMTSCAVTAALEGAASVYTDPFVRVAMRLPTDQRPISALRAPDTPPPRA